MDSAHARAWQVTGSGDPMFGRVLVGTDGSTGATEAVGRAARMAALTEAPLDVVFVIDTHRAQEGDVEARADAALGAGEEAARALGASVRSRIVAGHPSEVLLREAAEHEAGLVAVGPDEGPLRRAFPIGRVAAHMLRHAPMSVLVGRAASDAFPSRIEAGVDGAEGSTRTAAVGASIAAASKAELRLHHVIEVVGADADTALDDDQASPPGVEEAMSEARRLGVAPVREVSMGRSEHALVEHAAREDVDLVVVGHHKRGGLVRVFLGSVSEHVARHARCSVLVVAPSTAA